MTHGARTLKKTINATILEDDQKDGGRNRIKGEERKEKENGEIHQFTASVCQWKVVNLDGPVARGSASFAPIHLTVALSGCAGRREKRRRRKEGERTKGGRGIGRWKRKKRIR